MKIAVLGAGGIGGYVGGRLAEAGHDVTLVARGAHLAAIRADGLRIESPHGNAHLTDIRATDDPGDIGPVDIVLVTVKLPDLDAIAAQIPALVGPRTRIITAQNGIDARDMIGRHVDPAIIAQSAIYLAAYLAAPGTITTPGGKHLMVVDALGDDPTMAAFFAAIGESPAMDVTPVPDPTPVIWGKFTGLAAISAITAITRLPLGGIYASDAALALTRTLLHEAVAVAEAKGIALPRDHVETVITLFGSQPAAQSSSLLVDILAGKPTELAWLSGRVHALGGELSVPTPAHSFVWTALTPFKDGPPRILP